MQNDNSVQENAIPTEERGPVPVIFAFLAGVLIGWGITYFLVYADHFDSMHDAVGIDSQEVKPD